MKIQKLFLIAISFLLISGVLAQVTEGNYFKYGEIDADGNVIGSINPIENVSVIGFVCENENCESVSKRLWNNILNTITDYIELIYPTSLLSTNGYGIYMFKPGYIPFEVHADWAGNGDAGDYDNYLTKKQLCISKIETLDVSHDGENTHVDVFVNSPLKSFGPLDYVPAEIEEHYKTNVIVNLKVYENSSLFYEETKSKIILPSQGNFEFSFPADEGVYEIKITTGVDDLKCLDFEEDTEEKSIEVTIDECNKDEDCNEDYTSEAYCLENDIFENLHDFSCVQGTCKENVIENLLNECANGCIYGECIMECSIDTDCGEDYHSENYCLDEDVYNDFHDFVCDHNQCFEDAFPELVKECTNGCANGDCITPQQCTQDSECGEDFTGEWAYYCDVNDVHRERQEITQGCENGTCFEDIFWRDEFFEHCEYGCSNGVCITPEEPECGNGIIEEGEECDDLNLINGDGCDQNCMLETCSSDNDCPADSYSDIYCAEGDVYRDFTDYFCNESCSFNITKKLIEECNYGCNNGECQEEEEDDEDDGDNDKIERDKKLGILEDDEIFNAFESIDYSMFKPIDLTSETSDSKVSGKIPLFIWVLIFLVAIAFVIVILLMLLKR